MVTVHGKKEEGVTVEEKAELLEGDMPHGAAPGSELLRAFFKDGESFSHKFESDPKLVRDAAVEQIKEVAEALGLSVIVFSANNSLEDFMEAVFNIDLTFFDGKIKSEIDECFKNHPV